MVIWYNFLNNCYKIYIVWDELWLVDTIKKVIQVVNVTLPWYLSVFSFSHFFVTKYMNN